MAKTFVFLQLKENVNYADGLYNGKYNAEPALIMIKDNKPSYVQFSNNSSIYERRGILLSSVEILVEEQKVP